MKPIIPEVIEPDESLPRDLVALRNFAYLMDEAVAIPGTKWRVGLDAAIGLIPGIGDVAGGLLSGWIVLSAFRHRVPFPTLLRMMLHVVVDIVIGAIPLIGDIFDFAFEENVMNLKLLLRHRDRKRPPRTTSEIVGVALLIAAVIAATAIGAIVAVLAMVLWVIGQR